MSTSTCSTGAPELESTVQDFHTSVLRTVDSKHIIDFTLKKLQRFLLSLTDDQQRKTVSSLIDDYIAGTVSISWKRGRPTWIKHDTIQ